MAPRKTNTKTKKNNGWGIAHIPITSWILFWALVLATMALAAVCFNRAFVNQETQELDQASVEAYKAIADNLEKQMNEMEGTKAPTSALGEACLQESPSPIDNYLTYVDQKTSVNAKLPFGTAWQNEECIFPPAKLTSGGIINFGPAVSRSENTILRDSTLTIQSEKTVADFNTEIEQLKAGGDIEVSAVRQRTVNGLRVFSYNTIIPPGYITNYWYALGNTYSYKIESIGWLTDAEAVKIIQSLRVTE